MGESSCCSLQSFSLALDPYGTADATSQPRHPLTDSISFGRFASDSLAWDKWSTFSHKRYVEEAASYSRPGSVAQKKAFFEEYYKRKALLAQEATDAQNQESNSIGLAVTGDASVIPNEGPPDASVPNDPLEQHIPQQDGFPEQNVASVASFFLVDDENLSKLTDIDNRCESAEPELSAATTEVSQGSEMEKPLLMDPCATKEVCSSMRKPKPPPLPSLKPAASLWPSAKTPCPPAKPGSHSKTELVTSSAIESLERIKMSPKPLFSYTSRTPARYVNRSAINSSKLAKDIITPLRTPAMAPQAKKSTVTPKSDNRRNMTPLESATPANRTTGSKWRFLSGLENKSKPSPTPSTPFNLRTEERAAKRKEKLELKFNAKAPQKAQLQTKLKDKAESELKKLRQTLCFRARPLPSFYKDRKAHTERLLSPNPPVVRKSPNPKVGKIAKNVCKGPLPAPPHPANRTYSSQKNKASGVSAAKAPTHPRLLAAISDQNNSPNIPIRPPQK